ncbi:class I SAM-dependent methyltransferase [Nocardioides zeae]|uniref:Class I SAM-dependent methyltransferase n=1 Tax=Nocardioides zeae TaxID=1457234 RepID=A0A6P0HEU8_9ACTN|nr:class I SAM-dependent methyltransferase [Nocardioides zeae]NEN77238.1 class I SAM-dependent methyltransferase [Nocardioides zeae]
MSHTTAAEPIAEQVDAAALQARLDEYWTGRAAAYHRRQVEGERAALDRDLWTRVWRGALGPRPLRVLDVGTGSGYVAHVLAELGHDVVGLDSADGMLAEARRDADERRRDDRPAARFVRGDAVRPGDTDEIGHTPFDAVTSRWLLWTLRDPVDAVRAWSALVRPGGTIACVDANWYPDGIDRGVAVESADGPDAFGRTYDLSAEAALPLATSADADAFVDVFRAAGLVDVATTPIHEVAELDRRFGVSPGHESRPQHLVTGRVPLT